MATTMIDFTILTELTFQIECL